MQTFALLLRRRFLVMNLCCAFAGLWSAADVFSQNKLLLGYSSLSSNQTPIWVAKEEGFYKRLGIDADLILIEGSTPEDVCTNLRGSIDALGIDADRHEEPMLNIIGHYDDGTFRLVVFPRRAHRPAAFYRKDAHRIMVSPAVMEMGGMIVTPSETDFNRLDAETIQEIYREVSLMP